MLSVTCYMKMAIIPGETGKNIVIDTPQKQKSRKLFILFVAVIILTGVIIYFGFGNGPSTKPETANIPEASSGVPAATEQEISQSNKILELLNSVSLNNPIFKDKKFQSLILSAKLPVAVGEKGRENPFAPF